MTEKMQKVVFWLKVSGVCVALFLIFFLGMRISKVGDKLLIFFGFKEKTQNKTIIDEITKIETGQGKTQASLDFLASLMEKYK